MAVRQFCVEQCLPGASVSKALLREQICEQHEQAQEQPSIRSLLDWPRTRHDPFKEVWELIVSWVLAYPERTPAEVFRELQRLFPQRYQPSQLRTLQRGVRKIRVRLRETRRVQWQEEGIPAEGPDLACPQKLEQEASKTELDPLCWRVLMDG
jgi:hypothetical protein